MLETIEINPDIAPLASVIWLHGFGADASDFVSIIPSLSLPSGLPIRFIFPHAPYALYPTTDLSGRAWFKFDRLGSKLSFTDIAGLNHSKEQIHALIDMEISRGIAPSKIMLAGFSQGAAVAVYSAILHPKALAGALCLSGFSVLPECDSDDKSRDSRKLAVAIMHGLADDVVPYELAISLELLLIKYGCDVELKAYDMRHSLCQEQIKDIADFIVRVLY